MKFGRPLNEGSSPWDIGWRLSVARLSAILFLGYLAEILGLIMEMAV